ncbi:MAG: type II secretion system protein GspN [Deltaproteobacteria bacterium]|jgi:type II secretion system protein N|nr:type II secretion system protein GspN [Deltaproteobacteria bacterium]
MKIKPVLLYILFFMAAFLLFIYILFPQKDAAGYISGLLDENNSKLQFSCERVKLKLPLKLSMENPKFLINKQIHVEPELFEIKLSPALFFKKHKQIVFQSDLYKGSLNGVIDLKSFDSFLLSKADVFISKVKIDNFGYKTDLADIILGCVLNGEYKYSEISGKKGGNGKIIINDFYAKMENSFFNTLHLPVVDFSEVKIEFEQQSNVITIRQCTARGSVINLKLKGRIDIVSPLYMARLDLTGVILQDSPYLAKFANIAVVRAVEGNILQNGIKFDLTGTLNNPKISI